MKTKNQHESERRFCFTPFDSTEIIVSSDCSDPTNFTIYTTKQLPSEIINSDTNTYTIFFFLVNFLRALRVYDSLCPLRYFMAFLQLGFCFTFVEASSTFFLAFCLTELEFQWDVSSGTTNCLGMCRSSTAGSDQFLISFVIVSFDSFFYSHSCLNEPLTAKTINFDFEVI